jgi:hypothetical protein
VWVFRDWERVLRTSSVVNGIHVQSIVSIVSKNRATITVHATTVAKAQLKRSGTM